MFLGDRKQIIQTFILNEDPATMREAPWASFVRPDGRLPGMFRATDGLPSSCACSTRRCTSSWRCPRALDVRDR